MLFTTGERCDPTVVVAAHAAVRDADLQANTDRWVREAGAWTPPDAYDGPWDQAVWFQARAWRCAAVEREWRRMPVVRVVLGKSARTRWQNFIGSVSSMASGESASVSTAPSPGITSLGSTATIRSSTSFRRPTFASVCSPASNRSLPVEAQAGPRFESC
jgi:hypothetical protein